MEVREGPERGGVLYNFVIIMPCRPTEVDPAVEFHCFKWRHDRWLPTASWVAAHCASAIVREGKKHRLQPWRPAADQKEWLWPGQFYHVADWVETQVEKHREKTQPAAPPPEASKKKAPP